MFRKVNLLIFSTILIVTGNLSYADFNVKTIKILTRESVISINKTRVLFAAKTGYCFTEMYYPDEHTINYFKVLGFKVIKDSSNMEISWCD